MCDVTSVSVSLLVTLRASSEVTFYCVWVHYGFVPRPVPHCFYHVHFYFTWYILSWLLTGLFFVGFFPFTEHPPYMLAAYQSCYVTSIFIHCAAEVSDDAATCLNTTHLCVMTSVSRNLCLPIEVAFLYLLPDLQNPSLLNMSSLIRAFMSQLTHATFLPEESLCQTHED